MTAAPFFIPSPFKNRSMSLPEAVRELSILVGQVDLRADLSTLDLTGGQVRVTVRVRNMAGERCKGVFRVHVFKAATAGGAIVTEWDMVTGTDGVAEQDVTAGAGSWYFHAAVLGLYAVKASTVT